MRNAALDFYPALMHNPQDPPSLRYVGQGFAPNKFIKHIKLKNNQKKQFQDFKK